MAITYGFFNSINGDRVYSADDLNNVIKSMVSDGVYPEPDECLMVEAPEDSSAWEVQINPGTAIVKSHYFNSTIKLSISLDPPNSQKRIDRVCLRLDVDERLIKFVVIKGTPNAIPTAPDIVRTGKHWDLALANVTVDGEVGGITADCIWDLRQNYDVCGIITGLVRSNGYIDGYFNRVMEACAEVQDKLDELGLAEDFAF